MLLHLLQLLHFQKMVGRYKLDRLDGVVGRWALDCFIHLDRL